MELTSTSPDETERIAARVARVLRVGDVVTVEGELGTGKTTFVRGACRALGVRGAVTSPTFTLAHRYTAEPDVSHIDLYRVDNFSKSEWGDLEPYFEDAICFVEWPDSGRGWLPRPRLAVRLRHGDVSRRLVRVDSEEKSLLDRIFAGADPLV